MSEDDRLQLPRGAFIAYRQSGGLRFSTREVIVYNDGRVIARRQGRFDAGEGSRCIPAEEVVILKESIAQSSFFVLPQPIGQPNPDGYAYEIVARFKRKTRLLEFFDGSIPSELQSLLAQLKTLATIDNMQE